MRVTQTVAGAGAVFAVILILLAFWLAAGSQTSTESADAYVSDVSVHNSAPGVNDDIDLGYLPGYIWVDQTGGAIYVAESVADGAAVWTDVTAGGSTFNAEEIDALVAANVDVLDFGLGFDLTESPAGEVNIVLDLTEDQIVTGEITDGTILEADLAAVDSASDEECLTYESTGGDFEWQTCGGGGGSGTVTTVKQDNVQVGDADIVTIDFGDGLTCTESPDTEINCTIDLGESIDLTAEVTGTLPVGNGGTGQTAATADAVLVANGSAYVARVIPDCDGSGQGLNFDITTDAWTCRSGLGGGSGSLTTLEEGDVQVGDADIVAIDFGAGFDLTESPDTEINIVLDYTEDPVDLSTGEITGTLGASNGGTGQTAATADAVLIANGSAYVARVIPDCDANTGALNYDQTTDAWTCRNAFSIQSADIDDGTILEADLAVVDSPTDEECLTYEATGGDFEWQSCGAGGGGTENLYRRWSTQSIVDSMWIAGCVSGCDTGSATQDAYGGAGINDTLYGVPFYVHQDMTLDAIIFGINTAGAAGEDARLGIYDVSQTTMVPSDLVIDCGTAAVDSTGEVTVTCSQALTGGNWYMVAFVTESTTAEFDRLGGGADSSGNHVFGSPVNGGTNRVNHSYKGDFTCGAGCSNSLPDPFSSTNPDVLNSIADGGLIWLGLDLG